MDWLKPFMTKRTYKKGKVLFRKNDRAYEMYYVVIGKFLVTEIGVTIPAGQVFASWGCWRRIAGAPRAWNASRRGWC
jgi:hypothetical protein